MAISLLPMLTVALSEMVALISGEPYLIRLDLEI